MSEYEKPKNVLNLPVRSLIGTYSDSDSEEEDAGECGLDGLKVEEVIDSQNEVIAAPEEVIAAPEEVIAPPEEGDREDQDEVEIPVETSASNDAQDASGYNKVGFDSYAIVEYPDPAEFKFYLECALCWHDSSPPPYFCNQGHVTCECCYKPDMETCMAILDNDERCGLPLNTIDNAIVKTPYFQFYMEEFSFACGAQKLGCTFIGNGNDLLKHEMQECKFRFIRTCGFQGLKCFQSFHDVESYIAHLCRDHKLPMGFNGDGHFLFKYDRTAFMEKNGELECNVIPLIRAVIAGGKRKPVDYYCLLMGKDYIVNNEKFTRIWLCNARPVDPGYNVYAELTFMPPPSCFNKGECMKFAHHTILEVLPDIYSSLSLGPKDNGRRCIDIPHRFLDDLKIERNGEKYFSLILTTCPLLKPSPNVPENLNVDTLQDNFAELIAKAEEYEKKAESIQIEFNYHYEAEEDLLREQEKIEEKKKYKKKAEKVVKNVWKKQDEIHVTTTTGLIGQLVSIKLSST